MQPRTIEEEVDYLMGLTMGMQRFLVLALQTGAARIHEPAIGALVATLEAEVEEFLAATAPGAAPGEVPELTRCGLHDFAKELSGPFVKGITRIRPTG